MIELPVPLDTIQEVNLRPELLLDSGAPRALYSVTPRKILGQEWWDKERKAAYIRAGGACLCCGDRSLLEAHEIYKIEYKLARIQLQEVVALCVACHKYVHLDILLARRRYSEAARIQERAYKILRKAKITIRKKDPNNNSIPFNEWHLKLKRKKYYPVFDPY